MAIVSPPAPGGLAIANAIASVGIPTRLAQGELVRISMETGAYNATVSGTSTVTTPMGQPENLDGTGRAILMRATPGIPTGCSIRQTIYGRVVGVRWRRDANTPNFSVVVDGVSYPIRNASYRWNATGLNLTDGESYTIVAENLPDGPHSVEVILTSEAGIPDNSLFFYGFLAERRAGYTERLRTQDCLSTGTLTTTAAGITRGSSPKQYRGLRKVLYTNTSGSPATVTVRFSANTIWQSTIAAGASDAFDPGDVTAFDGSTATLNHLASAASAINFAVFGRI